MSRSIRRPDGIPDNLVDTTPPKREIDLARLYDPPAASAAPKESRMSRLRSNFLNYCLFTFVMNILFIKTWIAWAAAIFLWAVGGKAELPGGDKPSPGFVQKFKDAAGEFSHKLGDKYEDLKEKSEGMVKEAKEAPKKALKAGKNFVHKTGEKVDQKVEEVKKKFRIGPVEMTPEQAEAYRKHQEAKRVAAETAMAAHKDRQERYVEWWEKCGPNATCYVCREPISVTLHGTASVFCPICHTIINQRRARAMKPAMPPMPPNWR